MKIKNKGDMSSLEMTPMIDVVFQLLIFFIVALKHDDLYANLETLRPQPPKDQIEVPSREPIAIKIDRQGFAFQGMQVSEDQLKTKLLKIARLDPATMIHVTCEADSPHGSLVKALDACYGAGLRRLSVTSR